MRSELGPAIARMETVVHGLAAAIPGTVVALVVFVGFLVATIVKRVVARVTVARLRSLTQPFRIGDQIVATYDGRRVVVPNAGLFTDTVVVNTAFAHRRLEYDVGIGYGDDIERARSIMMKAVLRTAGVLDDPVPDVLVMDFAPSSVMLRVRWWIAPPKRADALDARDKVLTAIKHDLIANGIDLPFPTQQILFHDQTEETDGDRARQREGWPAGTAPAPAPRKVSDAVRSPRGADA